MKNIILIIALSLVFTNCKKKEAVSTTPAIAYCIWYNQTCIGCPAKVFYKCTDDKSQMQKSCIELRDKGLFYEVIEKSKCSECK